VGLILAYLVVLPLSTYLEIHGSPLWGSLPSFLLAGAVLQLLASPAPVGVGRPARGLTALVVAYGGLAVVQAFNPALPSVTLGLRGARLFVEPLLLFFVGVEVARRPELLRRVLTTVAVVGGVVALYAIRQALVGFDPTEAAWYRRSFAVSYREQRVFGTMAGATVLGHHMALVACLGLARAIQRGPWWPAWGGLAAVCGWVALLTGQRGVLLAFGAGIAVVLGLALSRPETRHGAARAGQAVTVVAALVVALAVATPVQDRRLASAEGTSAFQAARIKLAQLKAGGDERSLALRVQRVGEMVDAVGTVPLGAGTGLHLLVDRQRVARTSVLGASGLGDETYEPPVAPIPGELYWYTVGTELGVVGLGLLVGLLLFGIVTAGGVAVRLRDPERALVGLVAAGYLTVVVVDSGSVDAMTSDQVASYAWLLLGMVGTWAHAAHRTPAVDDVAVAA